MEVVQMKDVIVKINEMVELLEEKLKSTDVLNSQLSIQKSANEEKGKVLLATEKRLAALDRIYKKYDDFEKAQKDFEERMISLKSKESSIAKESHELDIVKKDIAEKNKAMDARKEVLNKQALALKEREAYFNKKRDELKDMISGKAIKDLLK